MFSYRLKNKKHMNLYEYFILLFLFCVIRVTSKNLTSTDSMKWIDAQFFCRDKEMVSRDGKLSLDEEESRRYWTRHYTERSDWIHFLGCYDQDKVLRHQKIVQTILDITVCKCQEFCLTASEIFGMRGNSCVCLSEHQFQVERLHISKCNWFVEGILQGGNNSFNVYRTTDFSKVHSDIAKSQKLCVQLHCDKNKRGKFISAGCDSFGNAFCTNGVLEDNFTWEQALRNCAQQSNETHPDAEYLLADINLNSDSSNLCSKYSILNDSTLWLGIQSIPCDAEYNDSDAKDIERAIRCRSCEVECKSEHCNESRQAFCEPLPELVTKHKLTSQSYTGTVTSIQKVYSKASNMTIAYGEISAVSTDAFVCNSEGYTGSNESVYTAVVYNVPLAVVIIILVVCLLYCRKKHNKKQKMEVESTAGIRQSSFQLVAKTDFYELAYNSNVSQLNPESEAIDIVNTSDTGISEKGIETSISEKGIYDKAKNSNVSELTESVYNHLREGDTSVEQKENIYDRSTMLHDGRNSLYDFTTNKTNQKVSLDPTYDHAVPLDRLKKLKNQSEL